MVLVGLLGAIIGGVCATAVAGARRTSSAADRLQQAAGEPDALIDATEVDPATWARIAQLPSVVRSGRFAYTFVAPAQDPDGYYPVFTRTDGLDDSLGQGHLVAGRRVRPGAADEVVLAEPIADRLDVGVGDLLHLASWSPEGALQVAVGDPIEPDGPAIDLRVVGLTRSTQDVLSRPDDVILTFLGPGVHDRYREEIGVADGLFLADLRGGDGALDVLAEEMRQVYPDGPVPRIDPAGVTVLSLEDSLNVLAGGLYIFAAVAGLFGLGAIAQVATRSVARGDAEQRILAGLGLTRRGRLLDAWLPIGAAAVVGGVGAVVVAVVASSAMPIGLAHRVDPALGTSFDGLVLPVAGLSVVVVIGGIGAGAAWRLAARPLAVPSIDRSGDPQRPVAVLARRGPPAVAVGLSMAAVSGRRPEAGAVRASMLGIAVAVAGLAAVAVFGSSMARLLDTPERYGWSWDVAVRLRGEATAEDIAASSDVEAVALGVFNQTVQIDGRPYNAMALAPLTGDASPAPVEGRAPLAPDEVALGADTRWELGDPEVVTALGSEGDGQEFRVVGTAIMPTIDDPIPIAEGAVFSLAGLDQLGLAAPVEDSSGFRGDGHRLPGGDRSRAGPDPFGPRGRPAGLPDGAGRDQSPRSGERPSPGAGRTAGRPGGDRRRQRPVADRAASSSGPGRAPGHGLRSGPGRGRDVLAGLRPGGDRLGDRASRRGRRRPVDVVLARRSPRGGHRSDHSTHDAGPGPGHGGAGRRRRCRVRRRGDPPLAVPCPTGGLSGTVGGRDLERGVRITTGMSRSVAAW